MDDYKDITRAVYGDAWFIPRCVKCKRFVKPDKTVTFNGLDEVILELDNCTCSKCGRSNMIFDGYYGKDD